MRTPKLLEHANDALDQLDELNNLEFGSLRIEEIEFSPGDDAWKDSTAWRIPKRLIDSFPDLLDDLKKLCTLLAAWAIHDAQSDSFKSPTIGIGVIEQFLKDNSASTVFQIYLSHDKDSSR